MKYKIDMKPLVDYYVVAVKDKETLEVIETFTLNESGVDMLRLFCMDKDVEEVAQEISILYDAPIDLISKDVKNFADNLKKKRLI